MTPGSPNVAVQPLGGIADYRAARQDILTPEVWTLLVEKEAFRLAHGGRYFVGGAGGYAPSPDAQHALDAITAIGGIPNSHVYIETINDDINAGNPFNVATQLVKPAVLRKR